MSDRLLAKGENMVLPAEASRLQVLLGWRDGNRQVDLDAAALLLDSDRRVLSDADFVFYNQPDSQTALSATRVAQPPTPVRRSGCRSIWKPSGLSLDPPSCWVPVAGRDTRMPF